MIINSKFKDYYDINAFVDKTIVYNRKEESLDFDVMLYSSDYRVKCQKIRENKEISEFYTYLESKIIKIFNPIKRMYYTTKTDYEFTPIVIGFCGKLYPCFRFIDNSYKPYSLEPADPQYIYDKNMAAKFYHKYILIKKSKYYKPIFNFKDFFDISKMDCIDLFRRINAPIFTLERLEYRNGIRMLINTRLKDFAFYKIYDAIQSNQKIQMFLTNELVKVDIPDASTGSSKVLMKSKGFDNWSFKREQHPRKPRGKSKNK